MQPIKSSEELKMVIYELEAKAIIQREELQESIHNTIESFKPLTYIKTTLNNIVSLPRRRDDTSNTIIGLGTGIILKKLVARMPGGLIKNVLAAVIQLGFTNRISKSPEAIKVLNREILDDEDNAN
jgi:hypothetical protein